MTVGLTGGIAAGKSTVAHHLVSRGAAHVDADAFSHALTATGGRAVGAVVACFGDEVLDPSGAVDRRALGRRVFASPAAREQLEGILHPLIREEIEARRAALAARGETDVLVVEAALLVEAGRAGAYDLLLVVEAPEAEKRARLVAGRGLSPEEAEARVAAQLPAGRKLLAADLAIWNDGDQGTLAARCEELWGHLSRS